MKLLIMICILGKTGYCQGISFEHFSFEGNMLTVSENEDVSFTFWLDTSTTEDPEAIYRMQVETRTSDGSLEYDGRVVQWNNTCTVTYEKSVRCIGYDGPAKVSKRVNRSHVEMVWSCFWKDSNSNSLRSLQRKIKLEMLRPFKIEKVLLYVLAGVCTSVAFAIAIKIFLYVWMLILRWRKQAAHPVSTNELKALTVDDEDAYKDDLTSYCCGSIPEETTSTILNLKDEDNTEPDNITTKQKTTTPAKHSCELYVLSLEKKGFNKKQLLLKGKRRCTVNVFIQETLKSPFSAPIVFLNKAMDTTYRLWCSLKKHLGVSFSSVLRRQNL